MNSIHLKKQSEKLFAFLNRNKLIVYLLFFVVSILQICLTRYVPSLDGPQHLYNATVLSNYLKSNELIKTFFEINPTIVGYWTAHLILTGLVSFLPSWLAEKIFLVIYILGILFSFRYLINSISEKENNFIPLLIFPFLYHQFILMGYYAFSFGTIFYFLAFGYYIHHKNFVHISHILIFSLLLLLLFLTHGLVYIFFVVSFIIYYSGTTIHDFLQNKKAFKIRKWLLKTAKLLLAAGPSAVLCIIYIRAVFALEDTITETSSSKKELLFELFRIRQLIGFHPKKEVIGYIPLFLLITLLSLYTIVVYRKGRKKRSLKFMALLNAGNIWFSIATVFFILYLFAPDHISAGSMTNRIGVYFFLLLIVWLSNKQFPKPLQTLTVIIVFFSIVNARIVQHATYRNRSKDIAELTELTKHMAPNTVVDYRLSSKNWMHQHIQLYAVLDKPFVHLRNVQCWGQFPMIWNYNTLPRCFAGEQQVRPSGSLTVDMNHPANQIDYFTVFKKDDFWQDTLNSDWQNILRNYYDEIYISEGNKCALYQRRKNIQAGKNSLDNSFKSFPE